ncbi:protein lifeguard 1 isoform X1 [Parasteatoda tepidariorum]|uniref:protein lifeguard 1 isoform X1 n=1 Tax=Parasteatoda tepidariorum TaxID=114398 RepID=UPI00077F9C6D|nr:protein lifeguard 1 isoform X1 [Parasteatoda tepidariorum]XP_042898973.1 protein lifeguard 1 isoform X1 [Parasteatoda tepidariorum]
MHHKEACYSTPYLVVKLLLGQNMKEFKTNSYYSTDSVYEGFGSGFSEKTIRMAFIQKVYSILMVQWAITVGFISLFIYNDSVQNYTVQHPKMIIFTLVMMVILMIAMTCCVNMRRTFPLNFICLFLFTFVLSFLLGVASCTFKAEEVMWAAGICAFICLGLTVFAFQTKYDFTMMRVFLCVALLCLVIFGILAIFLHDKCLVCDTQILIGGHHKYSISPKEYIFAVLNLYLDIINLFVDILRIIRYIHRLK